jgi:ketosteroid isomerase-like protein
MSRNIELFRGIIERGFNHGDMSVADEVCAPRLTEHEYLAPAHLPGPEILKSQIREARSALKDFRLTIEDMVEAGDKVWARMVGRYTVPRTGNLVTMTVIDICRFEDGRLVEHWGVPDRFAFLHQLGVLSWPAS